MATWTSTGRRVRQGLLLCALALAVLGMHHVAFGQHESPHETHGAVMATSTNPTQPSDDSGSGTGHELMHLCLAVLSAAGGLLLAWLVVMVGARDHAAPGRVRPPVWHAWRLPATVGRSLLASVCVLRI
jgi:hypothetical protein